MIRPIQPKDFNTVCTLVNSNWQVAFTHCVAGTLLSESACNERSNRLIADFNTKRLGEYVYEQNGRILAMLSIGPTKEGDKPLAYEVWRIYVLQDAQGKGLGSQLLDFAETQAKNNGAHEMVLSTFKGNTHAIWFYTKHGYVLDREIYLNLPYDTHAVRLIKYL